MKMEKALQFARDAIEFDEAMPRTKFADSFI